MENQKQLTQELSDAIHGESPNDLTAMNDEDVLGQEILNRARHLEVKVTVAHSDFSLLRQFCTKKHPVAREGVSIEESG
ncbi:hypothetical protein HAP94_19730 [Acidithiobacillus ferrivorans]|nr:hypothetical protein [Acidithiobacillus ferrivorans]